MRWLIMLFLGMALGVGALFTYLRWYGDDGAVSTAAPVATAPATPAAVPVQPVGDVPAATALLVAASVVAVLGPAGTPATGSWTALGLVVVLAVVALVGRGKAPFRAAMAIALVDVVLLTVSR